MSHRVLFPPPAKLGPYVARSLMSRWHIRLPELAFRAGVSQKKISKWLYRKVNTANFAEHGAVYDAMFLLVIEKAAWEAEALKREYAAFDARRAKMIAAGDGT